MISNVKYHFYGFTRETSKTRHSWPRIYQPIIASKASASSQESLPVASGTSERTRASSCMVAFRGSFAHQFRGSRERIRPPRRCSNRRRVLAGTTPRREVRKREQRARRQKIPKDRERKVKSSVVRRLLPDEGEPMRKRTADRLIERRVAADRLNDGDDGSPYESIAKSRVPARREDEMGGGTMCSYRELLLLLLLYHHRQPPPPATRASSSAAVHHHHRHHHRRLKNSALPDLWPTSAKDRRTERRETLVCARVQTTTEISPEDTRHHVQLLLELPHQTIERLRSTRGRPMTERIGEIPRGPARRYQRRYEPRESALPDRHGTLYAV